MKSHKRKSHQKQVYVQVHLLLSTARIFIDMMIDANAAITLLEKKDLEKISGVERDSNPRPLLVLDIYYYGIHTLEPSASVTSTEHKGF